MYKFKIITAIIIVAFVTSGCTISFDGGGSGTDGGLFKSLNNGQLWKQKTLVANISGRPQSFNFVNTLDIAIDPQDNKAIYVGTERNGMFYSYDGAASWQLDKKLGKRRVQSIVVDPKNKCTLYVANINRIFKSTDCNREWEEVYYDNSPSVYLSNLIIDPNNSNILYSGTSRGEVIASYDAGKSWSTLVRFNKNPIKPKREEKIAVTKVALSAKDPNILFATTDKYGVYKSANRGKNWTAFAARFIEIDKKDAVNAVDVAVSPVDGRTVIVVTKAGLIRSTDLGAHWNVMELIPPGDKTFINKIVLDPTDIKGIYYTTNTTFGWSEDGGNSWTSKKLPSSRVGSAIAVDYEDASVVYLGVRSVEK